MRFIDVTSRFKATHLLPLVLATALAGCATPAPLAMAPVPTDSPSAAPQAAAPSAAPIVAPEEASLRGLVELNGRGVAQATVTAYAPGSDEPIARVTTDEAGRFQMRATHAGNGAYRLQQAEGAGLSLIRLVAVKDAVTLATFTSPAGLGATSAEVNVRLDAATTAAVSGLAPLLNLAVNGTIGADQAHALLSPFTALASESRAGLQGTGTESLQAAIAGTLDPRGNGRLSDSLKQHIASVAPTFPAIFHRAIDATVSAVTPLLPAGTPLIRELGSLSTTIGHFPSRSGGSAGPNGPVAPVVASLSALAGPAAGGQTIVITGQRFTGTQGVSFGDVPATFTVDSDTQLTVTAPAHAAGTVSITLTTAGGTHQAAQPYAYCDMPSVAGVTPAVGLPAGGETVTLTGTHFTGDTQVSIGGAPATVTVDSDTQLTVTVPAGAAGDANVVVTTPGGSATAVGAYSYAPVPAVGSVSPATGPLAGGGTVTLTGTGFKHASQVTFGGVDATSFQVTDAQHIVATVPAGAAGAVDVQVTTPGGTDTKTGAYSYVAGSIYIADGVNAKPGVSYFMVLTNSLDLTTVTAVNYVDSATGLAFPVSVFPSSPTLMSIRLTSGTPLGTGVIAVTIGGSVYTSPQTLNVVP